MLLLTKSIQLYFYFPLIKIVLLKNFHWQNHKFETAVSKPILFLPEFVILSKDHFHVCVRVDFVWILCAFKHTNIGSCSFWKVASREAANTALGRWSDKQSKQQKTVTLFQYYDTHSPTQVHININS